MTKSLKTDRLTKLVRARLQPKVHTDDATAIEYMRDGNALSEYIRTSVVRLDATQECNTQSYKLIFSTYIYRYIYL